MQWCRVSHQQETEYVDSITIDQGEELTLNTWVFGNFTATVGPDWLKDGFDGVTWSSSDDDVCYTLENGTFLTWDEGECVVTATTVGTTEDGEHLTAQIRIIVDDSAADGGSAELPEELPEDVPEEFKARLEQIKAARAAKEAKDEEPKEKVEEAASEASSVVEEKADAAVEASSEEVVVDEAVAEASEEKEEDQAVETESDEVVEDQAATAGSNEEVVGGENDD